MAKYKSKKQKRKDIRQAILFIVLAIVIILTLFFLGIPLLVKLSIFIGDLRSTGEPIQTEDTMPPQTPVLQPVSEATKSSKISLKGYTEAGASVKIYLNGIDKQEVIAGKEGQFTINNLQLEDGRNKIKAKAIDKAENESEFSGVLEVELDTEEPNMEISKPSEGKQFYGDDSPIKIKGRAKGAESVYLNDKRLILEDKGNFSTNQELSEGENKLKFVARDAAGNKAEKEIKVNYIP